VRITFTTRELRHAGADWIRIQQLIHYGITPARVEADASRGEVSLQTENVRHLAVGPVPGVGPGAKLRVDGAPIGEIDPGQRVGLRRDADDRWHLAAPSAANGEKHPGASGPFGDLFRNGTVIVPGTIGSPEESFYLDWCASEAARYFRVWNGGVHRGSIPGESWMTLPIQPDRAYLANPHPSHNVIALGTTKTNALLAELGDRLPVRFSPGAIHLGERSFEGPRAAIITVLPHPDGTERYLAIHGGTTADAITIGAHLHWQMLPDWLAYDGGKVLGWGYFDNQWRLAE
jgi:hypothetical protein